jgi:hypothetical protein
MRPELPAALAGHPALWRGKQRRHDTPVLATGHARLDQALPGGGWPLGDTIELLTTRPGLGEFSLLLPALAQVTREGRWAMLINPPWTPYPPALCGHGVDLGRLLLVQSPQASDALWACEQALRGVHGGMLLAWPPPTTTFAQLRRLQLAARSGGKAAFLFRGVNAAASATPAPLRLHLHAGDDGLQARVLKCRGARPGAVIRLAAPRQQAQTGSPLPGTAALSGARSWHNAAQASGRPLAGSPA